MKFPARALVALAVLASSVLAFSPLTTVPTHIINNKNTFMRHPFYYSTTRQMSLSSTTSSSDEAVPPSSSSASPNMDLTDDEWIVVRDLVKRSKDDTSSLQDVLSQSLPTMNPGLIMKLKSVATITIDDNDDETLDDDIASVAQALQSVLDSSLASGKETLQQLLNAGEIRKLDAMIGKYARENKLDMAFFTVLNMNMSADSDKNAQILQHVYTRCQEEVEKTVAGGVALLNKLLRTQQESIRRNQLEHYLCPQEKTITTPDGKELELKGKQRVLVEPSEFMEALANAVQQIRTVEKAGGTSREGAAVLVEECRQVASEARIAIATHYGVDSKQLREFEDGLMPVFRPTSPDSPYIQGQS